MEEKRASSKKKKKKKKKMNNETCIDSLGADVLENILSRLPAQSFASASCVCRCWRFLCDSFLFSRPKLLSSLSLKPLLQDAFQEASSKILSEPIRPHFVIACIGSKFDSMKTHDLVRTKFGKRISVITCLARGIIGNDALTNELKEVKWNAPLLGENHAPHDAPENLEDRGIVLIVGFLPGLKVNLIPLLRANKKSSCGPLVELFLKDIKTYTASVSDSDVPMGIIMFADHHSDMRFVLEKMDCALGGETVILGNEKGCFIFSCGNGDCYEFSGCGCEELLTTSSLSPLGSQSCHDAVALVFAKDKESTHGIGEIRFNLAISVGVQPLGPTYKAASVRVSQDGTSECCTWLTARRERHLEDLDGHRLLSDLAVEVGNDMFGGDVYLGVMKQRRCSKSRKGKFLSSFAFHEVISEDEEYLFVDGDGIRTGDAFRFNFPSVETALATRNDVFEELKVFKNGSTQDGKTVEVFGGLIVTCYGRGESFFGDPFMDSSAFSENFPDIPLAGMFCTGEIGRLPPSKRQESKELNSIKSCLHVYSSVYLVMCYVREPSNP